MATRIQVRRGTNTQWNNADPILNEGEFGYSTTDSQFKIGDGSTIWSLLDYIPTAASLGSSLGDYIELTEKGSIDGVAELDGSKNILAPAGIIFEGTADAFETTLSVTDPTADRTITFPDATGTVALTSDIAELSQDAIDSALTAGTGITKSYNDGSNTLTLSVDTTTIQARVADVSDTEIGYLNGVTSALQTQLDAKAPLASPTFTGTLSAADLTISGNLTVNGTTTTINSTTLTVDDKNIVLADGNTSDASADGGGITLSGATSKTFNWVDATDAWTSSEHMNLLTGKSYKINNTAISAALPALTWGDVKNGKSGLVIS